MIAGLLACLNAGSLAALDRYVDATPAVSLAIMLAAVTVVSMIAHGITRWRRGSWDAVDGAIGVGELLAVCGVFACFVV